MRYSSSKFRDDVGRDRRQLRRQPPRLRHPTWSSAHPRHPWYPKYTAAGSSPVEGPFISVLMTMSSKRSKSPSAYRKACDLCQTPKDVLVRCRIDNTLQWHFLCTGKCWKEVSGGVVDGIKDKPHYFYGGMWKNKHACVSARKPQRKDQATINDWSEAQPGYTTNDRVNYKGNVWICRRSHDTTDKTVPGLGYRYWKEIASIPSASGD